MGSQQLCLKWKNHQSNMLAVFEQLLSNEALVDVTLACEGLSLKAHKVVLSACSPFFQALFVENPCKHPIVILKDMRYMDLKAIVEFMYRGEVNVSQDNFTALLKTAESLKVIGLAGVTNENKDSELVTSVDGAVDVKPVGVPRAESPPLRKRKRGRPRRRSPSDSNKSDSEDAPPAARIKAPDSPEIIEDGGMSSDRVTGLPAPSSSRTSGVAASSSPAVPSGAHHGSSVQASISQHTQDSIGDDVGECDDADFDVEPVNVMEESMTTEDVPVFLDVSSSQAPGDDSQQSRHTRSTSDNRALVPVHPLLPSDISIASQVDIKPSPSSLIPYGDQTLSPVVAASPAAAFSGDGASTTMAVMDASGVPAIAGPSGYQQSTPFSGDGAPTAMAVMDASAVPAVAGPSGYQSSTPFSGDGASTAMAFVDKSGVPAIAGPSGYQQSTPSDGLISTHRQGSGCPGQSLHVGMCSTDNSVSQHTRKQLHQHSHCTKRFANKSHLDAHVITHTGNRPHQCEHCGSRFVRASHLVSHIRTHTGEKPFQCQLCSKSFAQSHHLSRHMQSHKGEKAFQCHFCPQVFADSITLTIHEMRKHTLEI